MDQFYKEAQVSNSLVLVSREELDLLIALIRRRPGHPDDVQLQEMLIRDLVCRKPVLSEKFSLVVRRKRNG